MGSLTVTATAASLTDTSAFLPTDHVDTTLVTTANSFPSSTSPSQQTEVIVMRNRPALIIGATSALVAAVLVAPVSAPRALSRASAAGPVSGAVGLGGGLSGSVDERTGLFSVSVPVVSVGGPGSAGVSWSLVWDQGRAGAPPAAADRSGFGPGWSLGVSFVNAETPLTVYPANGGAYMAGGSFPSGLQDYPQQDLVFKQTPATPATPFTLSYDDGRVDSFNSDGNLVSRTDRFGNRTQLTWEHPPWDGSGWAPTSIVDGYGQTTTFTYSASGSASSVVVSAPPRSDGVVAKTTIGLDGDHRVTSVTDSTGAVSSFAYSTVSGSSVPLLTSVVSPSQAHTLITYQEIGYESGLTAVHSVVTVDQSGKVLGPARLFLMNPLGDQHNYTGYPTYNGGTTDRLFASGDRFYFYTTSIASCVVTQPEVPASCPGAPSSAQSTYDSQHRLVTRKVLGLGAVPIQTQSATYLPVTGLGSVAPNYARPMRSTVTYSAATSVAGTTAAGGRTVSTNRVYDSHGRVTQSTDEAGTTTATTYDGMFGLITGVTITGADGARSQTTNVLSADHKTISSATTAYAAPGQPLTARSTTSYLYDTSGQPTQRTMTWAPGAKPAGDSGGPDTVTTTFASSVDTAAHTRTITTTTAAGTPAASATTTVLDLVTLQPVRTTDPLGRVTSYRLRRRGPADQQDHPGRVDHHDLLYGGGRGDLDVTGNAGHPDRFHLGRPDCVDHLRRVGPHGAGHRQCRERGVHRFPDDPAVVGLQLQPEWRDHHRDRSAGPHRHHHAGRVGPAGAGGRPDRYHPRHRLQRRGAHRHPGGRPGRLGQPGRDPHHQLRQRQPTGDRGPPIQRRHHRPHPVGRLRRAGPGHLADLERPHPGLYLPRRRRGIPRANRDPARTAPFPAPR